jgi:hypothetical protein
MICNLTDLKCHLISMGAKFSDDWIKDLEDMVLKSYAQPTITEKRLDELEKNINSVYRFVKDDKELLKAIPELIAEIRRLRG